MSFSVYVNRGRKRACWHQEGCGYIKMHMAVKAKRTRIGFGASQSMRLKPSSDERLAHLTQIRSSPVQVA